MKIAHDHADWVKYIQDKLNVFERNNGWRFIPTPPYAYVVGLKWVFQNTMDKEGNVVR